MGDHLNEGWQEELFDGGFNRVADGVAVIDRQLTVHFEVEFHKNPVSGMAGPQIVQAQHARAGQHLVPDALAFRAGELAVEQLRQNVIGDPAAVPEHVASDAQRESRVGAPQPVNLVTPNAASTAMLTATSVR